MFRKNDVLQLLAKIGAELPVKIKAYMIGGGALSLRRLKETTKDIDLVLLDKKSLRQIKDSFEKIGYKIDKGLFKEQFYKDAVFVFLDDSGSRIDLLIDVVCGMLRLSETIQKRAVRYGFFDKLELYLVSNEDILLFKAVTDRPQDLLDIRALLDATNIDWDIIIKECVSQHREDTRWIFWFYEQICRLENHDGIPIPEKSRIFEVCLQNWDKKPMDFMDGIDNPEKHIPKKYLEDMKKG